VYNEYELLDYYHHENSTNRMSSIVQRVFFRQVADRLENLTKTLTAGTEGQLALFPPIGRIVSGFSIEIG
jgi:hypothetical protein